MTKTDKIFNIISWPIVFIGVAAILLLIGVNIYFFNESVVNLTASFELFIGSMSRLSATGAIFLIVLYGLNELD